MVPGKRSIFSRFTKDRNCDICLRTKNHKGPTLCEKFGDLMTAYHKVLSEGCESRNHHRYAVVAQDLATQWIQSYPCKTKTSQEMQKSLQKFLEPIGSQKSFTLAIRWNLANPVKIFPGIVVCQHHTDRKRMGLLKEQCAE